MRRLHEEMPKNTAVRAKQAQVQRAAEEPELLKLQRSSGNEAVTQMVQRDRAASTDAPGAHKHKKAPPKKAEHKWISGRVLGNSIQDGKTYISIGLTSAQGVQKGMQGKLLRKSGTQLVSFEVAAVDQFTRAYVEASLDEIKEVDHAEIDLGSAPESQEGKEF